MGDGDRRLQPSERRDLVLAEVVAGRGTVAELAEALDVSAATIRRDLQRLTDAGLAWRTYGGAVGGRHPLERTLSQKELSSRRQKDAIAGDAASLIGEEDVLVLDAGTTTGRLAHHLRGRSLTVVTNGVNTVATLAEDDGVELIVLGGQLRHTSQAMVGPMAEEALRHLVADKVFLGADGVVAGRGICCPTMEQASLKAQMAARGREVVVLADHSKLGAAPYPFFAPLRGPTTVVTDAGAPPEQLGAAAADPHLTLLVAPEPAAAAPVEEAVAGA
jgi:DeoR/GlpR family transcriptional regulator of sugar metabolism